MEVKMEAREAAEVMVATVVMEVKGCRLRVAWDFLGLAIANPVQVGAAPRDEVVTVDAAEMVGMAGLAAPSGWTSKSRCGFDWRFSVVVARVVPWARQARRVTLDRPVPRAQLSAIAAQQAELAPPPDQEILV
ncbi:hypothetical protein QTI66_32755 [Variovorax sp. J22R133]|uniref:hypothetical protein n=1 Tax=Variovorax brevis TaxID=3053503 RepID=UPI002576A78A|nr:hypothetical protein [Variovorax sp. J22R133]MDM0116899.1 hypothetical protein [Variovorax sp. J22R133]